MKPKAAIGPLIPVIIWGAVEVIKVIAGLFKEKEKKDE